MAEVMVEEREAAAEVEQLKDIEAMPEYSSR
jgi:hypothetical protein